MKLQNKPRVVLGAPRSGSGKTLVSIALMQALTAAGKKVSAYKCGPDYIDPMFHKKILGVPSRNLDLFFADEELTKSLFADSAAGSGNTDNTEISVIEGVMGLFDGIGTTDQASTYHLAKTLAAPIILIVDSKGMGRSVIAEIAGFLMLDKMHLIKGVILNNMSAAFYQAVKPAIESELHVPVLGYFPFQKDIKIESRYLGLKLPDEINGIKQMVSKAAAELAKTVDLKRIEKIAEEAPPVEYAPLETLLQIPARPQKRVRIALAKDEAFCFYYEDNIKLLEKLGAEIVEFSPLHDKQLPPEISGLILGGGYPEQFAGKLAANQSMKDSVLAALNAGLPSIAECGGFMYLHESIETQDGKLHSMVGAIKGTCRFMNKLVRFGYISISVNGASGANSGDETGCFLAKGRAIKAHEFHYFDSTDNGASCTATKPGGAKSWNCVHCGKNHWWGFPHLYFLSDVEFVQNFLAACASAGKKEQ